MNEKWMGLRRTPVALSCALLPLLGALGCTLEGSGNIVTEEFEIGPRTELEVCCGFEVVVTQGEERSLRITGDDNLLERLVVRERHQELEVRFPENITGFRPTQPILIEVTLSELREIEGSGGVDLSLGDFTADRLDIELSGGSTLRLDSLVAERFSLDLSGGGTADVRELTAGSFVFEGSGGAELEVRGSVSSFDVEASGGSVVDAFSCEADDVSVELSGGSKARVTAHETLDVEASGGSSVRYRGKPRIRKELTGGSSVEPD